MSLATTPGRIERKAVQDLPWSLWVRQIRAIVRLELKKTLLGKRSWGVYLLAAAPVLIFSLRALVDLPKEAVTQLGGLGVIFATVFRTFILRFALFFGCVAVFTNLFRGDVLERTLHYYFLLPLRREVLAVAKYASGLLTVFLVFGASTAASFLLLYAPAGSAEVRQFFFAGPGLGHLSAYLGVTLLACIGYGAVFLLMGLLFRNPIIPAAVVLGWESINFLLPPALKKISVIYYLESLCPVPLPAGPITLLADPAPAWVSIPGLLVLTAALLF
ncbi:MAG: hypothetical protein ACE5JX_13240, partial [Acidobacteriota bacterium]